jgi:hypothetical protein
MKCKIKFKWLSLPNVMGRKIQYVDLLISATSSQLDKVKYVKIQLLILLCGKIG